MIFNVLINYKFNIELWVDQDLLCGGRGTGWLNVCGHVTEHVCPQLMQMEKTTR